MILYRLTYKLFEINGKNVAERVSQDRQISRTCVARRAYYSAARKKDGRKRPYVPPVGRTRRGVKKCAGRRCEKTKNLHCRQCVKEQPEQN